MAELVAMLSCLLMAPHAMTGGLPSSKSHR